METTILGFNKVDAKGKLHGLTAKIDGDLDQSVLWEAYKSIKSDVQWNCDNDYDYSTRQTSH